MLLYTTLFVYCVGVAACIMLAIKFTRRSGMERDVLYGASLLWPFVITALAGIAAVCFAMGVWQGKYIPLYKRKRRT